MTRRANQPDDGQADPAQETEVESRDTVIGPPPDFEQDGDRQREITVKIHRGGKKPNASSPGHVGQREAHERAFDETEIREALVAPEAAGEGKAIVTPPVHEEEEEPVGLLHHPMLGWIAAGLLTALLVASALLGNAGGVDGKKLSAFYGLVDDGRYADAESMLGAMDLKVEHEVALRKHVAIAKGYAGLKHRTRARRHFEAKRYKDALTHARAAVAAEPDPDTHFLIAETLRVIGDDGFGEAYGIFLRAHPDDPRRDDALFWQAEALAKAGRVDEAKKNFAAIVAMETSDFKRSAERRLGEMK